MSKLGAMKNFTSTLCLLILSITLTARAEDVEIIEKGYRVASDSVIKDYTLMRLTPSQNLIAKHIVKIHSKIDRDDADDIAETILKVSSCLKVDPWVLTGLIQKESTFRRHAVSETNAVGLTQFTSIGFKEVNDQLGYRGRAGATENVTLYLSSKIRKCIDPSWVDLWNRIKATESDPTFYNSLKNIVKNDITASITYGAILLKTYLAHLDTRNEEDDVSSSELYCKALQIYNGEALEKRVDYAQTIFKNVKNLYPNDISFPFLKK